MKSRIGRKRVERIEKIGGITERPTKWVWVPLRVLVGTWVRGARSLHAFFSRLVPPLHSEVPTYTDCISQAPCQRV